VFPVKPKIDDPSASLHLSARSVAAAVRRGETCS
jgi:hypothetical protein